LTAFKQKSAKKSAIPAYLTSAFIMLMCVAVIMGKLPMNILLIYALLSALTFTLYWQDKRAAIKGNRRTPESRLQIFSLVGGWPGGLIAQRVLHHKSSKKSFLFTYWLMVLLNISGLFMVTSPKSMQFLQTLLQT
jgi:uncharacterized membrane protein YsdA (DUF1294 family)